MVKSGSVLTVLSIFLLSVDYATSVKDFYSNVDGRSCVCGDDFDADFDYFPVKLQVEHATQFEVEYFKSYKVVTDLVIGSKVFLYLCGTPVPGVEQGVRRGLDQVVSVPIQKASVDSTTLFPYFEYIGQRTSIARGPDNAVSACMQRHVDEEVATGAELSAEVADFAFIGQYTFESRYESNASLVPTNFFVSRAATEPTPLAQLEYTELVALFFNREEAASDIVETVESRIACQSAQLDESVASKSVATITLLIGDRSENCQNYGNSLVNTRKCPHPECNLVNSARGEIFELSNTTDLTLDDFIEQVVDVDVILIGADLANDVCKDMLETMLSATKAGQNNDVYDVFKTISIGETFNNTAHFEGLRAEPDVAVADLISILHPASTNHQRRFWRRAFGENTEPVTIVSANDCIDMNQPLFNEWTKIACNETSGEKTINGLQPFNKADQCPSPVESDNSVVAIVGSIGGIIVFVMIAVLAVRYIRQIATKK